LVRSNAVTAPPRRAFACRCAAAGQQQAPPQQPRPQQLAAGCLAALASASVLLSPVPALAVSGGGGTSSSLSFQDLSGQDLTKKRFTKGEMRQTRFDGANLAGGHALPRAAMGNTVVGPSCAHVVSHPLFAACSPHICGFAGTHLTPQAACTRLVCQPPL
jgi:hypothetical protein